MDEAIKNILLESFNDNEAEKMIEFFEKGFSRQAQVSIVSKLLYAKTKHIDPKIMIKSLQAEWESCWQYQEPSERADPDAPGRAGEENQIAAENINQTFGLWAANSYR